MRNWKQRPSHPAQQIGEKIDFTYHETQIITATTVPGQLVLRINSLYDPDYTYTGKQPYMFDQYAVKYANYIVPAVTVKLRFVNEGSTPVAIGCFPSSQYAFQNDDINLYAQYPKAFHRLLPSVGAYSVQDYQNRFNISRMLNIPEDSGTNIAPMNDNPPVRQYLMIYAQAPDETTAISVTVDIHIVFHSVLTRPLQVTDSLKVMKAIVEKQKEEEIDSEYEVRSVKPKKKYK